MVHLNANRFSSLEYKHKNWFVDAPVDHTLEDMLMPNYWAHISRQLSTGDEIVVWAEDNTYVARFYVIDAGANWAKVYCHKFDEITKTFELPEDADTAYIVEWSGNYHKHRVRRKQDGEVLVSQLKTREEALTWLKDYKKSLIVKKRDTAEKAA